MKKQTLKTHRFIIRRRLSPTWIGWMLKLIFEAWITGDSDKLVSWFVQTPPSKNRPFHNRLICFYYFSKRLLYLGGSLYASLSEFPVIHFWDKILWLADVGFNYPALCSLWQRQHKIKGQFITLMLMVLYF